MLPIPSCGGCKGRMEVRQRPRCESMAFGVLEFSGPENHVIFHWIYEVVHRFMRAKLGIVTYCNIFFHYVSWVYYSGNYNYFSRLFSRKRITLLLVQVNARKMIKIQKMLNLPPFYWDLFAKCCIFLGLL